MLKPTPDAYLLLAPGCAHCPSVLEGLSQLVKAGKLGRLEIVNIVAYPDAAAQAHTRSVPWCRIGPFELDGVQTPDALAQWTQHATEGTGLELYYHHLLETQRPHKVASAILHTPSSLVELLSLLEDKQTPMSIRIGVGVVLEELQGNPVLSYGLPTLQRLALSSEANIRADAAHYLGLINSEEAFATLNQLLQDEHPDVREIASESIELINKQA
jgi:hypothetical protein